MSDLYFLYFGWYINLTFHIDFPPLRSLYPICVFINNATQFHTEEEKLPEKGSQQRSSATAVVKRSEKKKEIEGNTE